MTGKKLEERNKEYLKRKRNVQPKKKKDLIISKIGKKTK